jgi:hypothetical protein
MVRIRRPLAGGGAPVSRGGDGPLAVRCERVSVAFTWGATPAERAMALPCDQFLERPDQVLHRAVDVDAPPGVVFRWLCQLRVAPYSYDWIDNRGRTSPRTLTPGLERLAVGQPVMTIFELAAFEVGRHLTLLLRHGRSVFGDIAVTYAVLPRASDRSRLVVRLRVRHPRGPLGWLGRWWLPWGDLVMMRKQLLTLRALAEGRR